ncbi:hypothetical protein V5F72_24120 [Xanthobacter flavus]|uniref:hypothetical protein n=1 Tax=Xanthobacter flavus TaxID=281 RepID=UPI00372C65B7
MANHSLAPKAQTPAPFQHQPELRALMMFPTLPPGHMTFQVQDNDFFPHLRRGEFAVVDLSDHQPTEGELFLISYRDPREETGFIYRVCQMRSEMWGRRPDGSWCSSSLMTDGDRLEPQWSAVHWNPPATQWEWEDRLHAGTVRGVEGPYTTEHAASKLVGRIVGVFQPAVEAARAAA